MSKNIPLRIIIISAIVLLFGLGNLFRTNTQQSTIPEHLPILENTLVHIQESYVNRDQIVPKKMLFAAMDSVQFEIPEVLTKPDQINDQLTVIVNDKIKKFSTKETTSFHELFKITKSILSFIQSNIRQKTDAMNIEATVINGMLSALDPHSNLLSPQASQEMDIRTLGHFGGLGILISMRNHGNLTVIRPIKNKPAYRAGIKSMDHIVKINDAPTENLTLEESVNLMRGTIGSNVDLWISRKNKKKPIRFSLTRELISLETVVSKLLKGKVGYLRIKHFSGQTAIEFTQAMERLSQHGAKSWIIDLRWNPGGLLEQALQISDLFIPQGALVTTITNNEQEDRNATQQETDTHSPIVVLINQHSASGSEIVAGAIKNLNRGLVLGQTTFGKGSIQLLFNKESDNSRLKLTIAEYLTSGNQPIQSVGVTPDIELFPMFVPKKIKTFRDRVFLLNTKHSFREKDLFSSLTSEHHVQSTAISGQLRYLYTPPKSLLTLDTPESEIPSFVPTPIDAEDFVEDYEIKLARALAHKMRTTNHTANIKTAKKFVAKQKRKEEQRLKKALSKININWKSPSKKFRKTTLNSQLIIAQANGAPLMSNNTITAGQSLRITCTVSNTGNADAYQVLGRTQSEYYPLDEIEFPLGYIRQGTTKSFSTLVQIPKAALSRIDTINVVLPTQNKHNIIVPKQDFKIQIQAQQRPVFAYTYQILDDNDGMVQFRETIRLRVTIKNIGKATAQSVVAILKNKSGGLVEGLTIQKGRFRFPNLKPNQDQTIEFQVRVNDIFDKDAIVLELSVFDDVLKTSISEKLTYPVHKDIVALNNDTGFVKVIKNDTSLYEGAHQTTTSIGTAPINSIFAVTGRNNDFIRIRLDTKRSAFIRSSNVQRTTTKQSSIDIIPHWQVTPPLIAIDIQHYETNKPTYTISARATDNDHIQDAYIFVSNRKSKLFNRKVFYQSNTNKNHMKFSHNIDLLEGHNLITIIARENNNVSSSKQFYLYYSNENPES